MKKTILLTAFLGLLKLTSFAQVVRTYSNDFLNIGVGARGLAMSNAQVASTSDVYSNYYNPAGLVGITNTFQLAFMHSEYFAGIGQYDYLAAAVPLVPNKRVIGFSIYRFGVDNIPNTLFLVNPDGSINYNNITSFSTADYAFMFHYAQALPVEGLSIGGSVKVIYRQIGSFAKAFGFGIDAGAQYEYKKWHFGLMARDITGTFDAWTMSFTDAQKQVLLQTNNALPSNSLEITTPHVILGAAYEAVMGKKKNFTILPEINISLSTDGKENVLIPAKPVSIDMNAGLELKYLPGKDIGLYLRAGAGNIQRATNEQGKKVVIVSPNIGAGIHIKIISIDYALTNLSTLSDAGSRSGGGLYSNVISVRLDITKKQK